MSSKLFLAASDDEDLPVQPGEESSHEERPVLPADEFQTPAKSPASLFFVASEEEDLKDAHINVPLQTAHESIVTDKDDVEVPDTSRKSAREHFQEPPGKKRRLSPTLEIHPQTSLFRPTYLGDVLIANAWSTASGKGYVKSGDSVIIQKDEPTTSSSSRSRSQRPVKKIGDKQQVTIASMMKLQKTKKADTIVRILNQRGFGIIFHFLSLECDLTRCRVCPFAN